MGSAVEESCQKVELWLESLGGSWGGKSDWSASPKITITRYTQKFTKPSSHVGGNSEKVLEIQTKRPIASSDKVPLCSRSDNSNKKLRKNAEESNPSHQYNTRRRKYSRDDTDDISIGDSAFSSMKRKYTIEECINIINYISSNDAYLLVKGNVLWKKMEVEKICERSWQSMKEQFLKKIIPKIGEFDIEEQKKKMFLECVKRSPPLNNGLIVPGQRGWRRNANFYSPDDDKIILKYILKGNRRCHTRSVSLWKTMEEKQLLPGRTWQSLKNRYLKIILPYLKKNKINEWDLDKLGELSDVFSGIRNYEVSDNMSCPSSSKTDLLKSDRFNNQKDMVEFQKKVLCIGNSLDNTLQIMRKHIRCKKANSICSSNKCEDNSGKNFIDSTIAKTSATKEENDINVSSLSPSKLPVRVISEDNCENNNSKHSSHEEQEKNSISNHLYKANPKVMSEEPTKENLIESVQTGENTQNFKDDEDSTVSLATCHAQHELFNKEQSVPLLSEVIEIGNLEELPSNSSCNIQEKTQENPNSCSESVDKDDCLNISSCLKKSNNKDVFLHPHPFNYNQSTISSDSTISSHNKKGCEFNNSLNTSEIFPTSDSGSKNDVVETMIVKERDESSYKTESKSEQKKKFRGVLEHIESSDIETDAQDMVLRIEDTSSEDEFEPLAAISRRRNIDCSRCSNNFNNMSPCSS